MAAWMLPTNDHSLFENMLGAAPVWARPGCLSARSVSHSTGLVWWLCTGV